MVPSTTPMARQRRGINVTKEALAEVSKLLDPRTDKKIATSILPTK